MWLFRWIIAISVLSAWAAVVGTAVYIALYKPDQKLPEASSVIVLSGGLDPGSRLGGETLERVTRGIALFDKGAARRIVFSGGTEPPAEPIAVAMAQYAVEAGVPKEAIVIEPLARSTLQNALFVSDLEAERLDLPILLVSHRYHLPRAYTSFRWAGFSDITNVAADPFDGFNPGLPLALEGLKWPYNVIRAAAASAAMAIGIRRDGFVRYLA